MHSCMFQMEYKRLLVKSINSINIELAKNITRILAEFDFSTTVELFKVMGTKWIRDDEVKMKHPVSYYFKNKNVVVTTSGNMSKLAFECTVLRV